MNISIGQIIGPWIVHKIIFKNDVKWVVKVKLNGVINEEILKNILNNNIFWIMKITDDMNEFYNFAKYELNTKEYGLLLPNNDYYSNGKIVSGGLTFMWFVMEEYCFDCSTVEYKNINLDEKKIIKSVVLFLKHIHRKYNIIHGDLKLKNILYKNNEYRVCDFETLRKPKNTYLCDENHFNNYYYYLHGCEYKKPVYSYRYDLQALGYILWNILNKYEKFEFQRLAQIYYERQENYNKFEKLEIIKNSLVMPDKIKSYFQIISRVDWNCLDPPPEEIYQEILNLYEREEFPDKEKME
jgi:serine/threonine protein kinase